jgi:magnesium transporter
MADDSEAPERVGDRSTDRPRERPEDRPDDAFDLDRDDLEALRAALDSGDRAAIMAAADAFHEADLADVIEQLAPQRRAALVTALGPEGIADALPELGAGMRDEVLALLNPEQIAVAVSALETDDIVYVLEDLEPAERAQALQALPPDDRAVVEQSLNYPEYSAGRLMQREAVTAPPFWTVGQMIDSLRASDDLPEAFYDVIVVDPAMRPVGKVALSKILSARRPVTLEGVMQTNVHTLRVTDTQEDVAYAFNQYHLVSAPVVDESGRLVGVITIDDAMVALSEEAEEDLLQLAGVGADAEISDSVRETLRQRFPWLLVNLVTAVLASAVIALFEDALAQVVALAVLMPIVASMGGNAGTQSLTVAVRGLATRDLTDTNARRVVGREMLAGLANGGAFAIIMAGVALVWFGDPMLAGVIAAAMVVNLLAAALAGVLIPILLDKAGADPALASGTFVTTVTDVVGFFAFLGLASAVLL